MTEQTNGNTTNEYKGFCLFNDIEDTDLRIRNRAVVMANIAEANSKERKISANGMGLIMGYFNNVVKEERNQTLTKFVEFMKERGYVVTVASKQV